MNDVQCVHIQDVSVRCICGKKVRLDILNNNMFAITKYLKIHTPVTQQTIIHFKSFF